VRRRRRRDHRQRWHRVEIVQPVRGYITVAAGRPVLKSKPNNYDAILGCGGGGGGRDQCLKFEIFHKNVKQ
jgi:hypothetical protein